MSCHVVVYMSSSCLSVVIISVVFDHESLSLLSLSSSADVIILVVVTLKVSSGYQRLRHFVVVIDIQRACCELCVYHSAATSFKLVPSEVLTKHHALDVTSVVVVVACRVVVSSVLTSTLTHSIFQLLAHTIISLRRRLRVVVVVVVVVSSVLTRRS